MAALAGAPAGAGADEQIVAGPPDQYLTPSPAIDQGERLTFRNNDLNRHDVTARARSADGGPLFTTPLLDFGGEAVVEGAQYLTTGAYDFYCSIHTYMTGRLTVTSAGTPAPRPGGGPGGGPAGDTRAPALTVEIADSKLSRVRKRGALLVRVSTDEPITVRQSAVARIRGKRVTLARGATRVGAGSATVRLALTKSGRKALKGTSRATVELAAEARDGANNRADAGAKRTLRG